MTNAGKCQIGIGLFILVLSGAREVDFHGPLRRPIFIFGKDEFPLMYQVFNWICAKNRASPGSVDD